MEKRNMRNFRKQTKRFAAGAMAALVAGATLTAVPYNVLAAEVIMEWRAESEEVIEAIENRDYLNLREELGDLLLQVLLHARIAEENGEFTLEDVIDELGHKLVRRHPHVFGDEGQLNDAKAGHTRWNDVKKKEKLDRISEYEQWISDGRLEPQVLDRYKKMLTDKGLL